MRFEKHDYIIKRLRLISILISTIYIYWDGRVHHAITQQINSPTASCADPKNKYRGWSKG